MQTADLGSKDSRYRKFKPPFFSLLGFVPLLDQPIRSGEHFRRNRQADLLGSLEIDHQLKLGRLLDRQIGRLGSLQDSVQHNMPRDDSYPRGLPRST